MAVGREEIRAYALGTEMAGLDGWHYDYVATVMDETTGMVDRLLEAAGRDRRRATARSTRSSASAAPGSARQRRGRAAHRLAARLVRPRLDRAHVPGDRRLRQGAAGPAGPDAPERDGAARALPARRPALDGLAAAGRGGGARHPGVARMSASRAPRMLIDGKLVEAGDGGDVPDPQPGHRPGDRAGARRHRRRRGRRDRRRPPRLRRDRLVDEPRVPGALPAPAAPGAGRPRRARCGR